MAENQDPNIEGPDVEARAEFIRPGTTDVKSFLPFGTGFHDPEIFTFNPEPNPVQLEDPRNPKQTPTIQKDQIRDTTVGFNPFDKSQLAKSATGSQSFAENLGKKLSHQLSNLEDPNQYAKSFMYDASSSGAHKARYKAYGQKTYDKIGFNPELNNEEVFNANTSMADDYIRMATHAAWPMFTLGLISNPKSYGKIFQGDIGQDIDEATDYEEYNAIGMSTKGGIGGFFNNTINSLAYSAGIMFEAAAEYAAIGAIEGTLVGPEGTIAGGLLGGAVGAVKGLASLPKNLYNMGKYGGKMLTNLKNLENYTAAQKFFASASKGTFDFINPINNTRTAFLEASNLSGLARTAKTSAGLFRDVIGMNMGLSEGRLEGGFVENNTYSRLYDEFWKRTNRAPTDEEQVNLRKQSKVAGFQDTYKNALLVFYSNKIAFPNLTKGNIFAGQSRTIRSVGKEFDIVFQAGKGSGAKAITEGAYDIVDFNLKNALKGFIKPANFGKATLAYFKTNLVEGAQEVMQDVLAKSTEDYYVNSYYDPTKANFDYSMATLGNAFGHQVSAEGFETFMSGFVMGGLLRPFNGAVPRYASILYNKYTMDPVKYEEYMEERKTYGEAVKNAMNNMHQNPVDFLNERMRNYGDQSAIAKIINDEETDTKEKFDGVDASFTSDVLTSLNAGTYKVFKDNFAKYGSLSDRDLEEALEIKPGEGAKMRVKLQEYSKKADKIQDRYEYAQKNLATKKLQLQDFKENTPEYNKAAIYNKAIDRGIYNLVFLNESFDQNLERVSGITNKLNSSFVFSNLPSANFQTLTDPKRLTNTIDMLSTEIETLKQLDDPKAQAQVKDKQEILEALSEFEEKQSSFNKMQAVEVFEEAKKRIKEEGKEDADATAAAFDELINYYKENGQDPVSEYKDSLEKVLKKVAGSEMAYQSAMISMDRQGDGSYRGGIDSLFNDLVDLHRLEHDNRNIIPYINMLMQPASFYEHVERNYEWMRNLYINRENYYKDIIDQSIKAKENNDLLKSLADDNIYVDLEEFADWVEDPSNLPSYFIEGSKGQERVIPAGSLAYEQYAQNFIMVARMQENKAAGDPVDQEAQLEEAIQDLLAQKQIELDQAQENFKSDIQKETGSTLEELQQQEQEGKEVVKPISEDAKNAKIQKLSDAASLFNTNDPVVQIDKLQEAFRLAGLPEEIFSQSAIDIEVSKLQTDQERLIEEVVPIFNAFETTYDQGLREQAAYGTAAAVSILTREAEKIQDTEGEITEIEPVEIINQTQSWKDYQAVIKEIDDRYAEFIQELTDSFAKKGVTSSTAPKNVIVPTNTSWSEIEKLAPELFEILDKKFADDITISPEDDKYDLVRSNWLEQQGEIIQEYNNRKLAEKILQEQEAKQFKAPTFKFIKLPKGYEINITSRITPLTLLRDTYQNMLDSGERTSEKTGKILKLTDKQKQDILDDLGQLDNAINFLREQGIQTENSSFDKALQIFNDLIIARQNEIEKVFDEEGNLVSRKIDGKTAERVTKKAEELDIQLTPGKKPFSFYALDTQIKTIKDEEGVEQEVEIPSPILSAFDSIMADDSIKPEDKLDAFMASFEAFAKSTKTSVFKDKNQKGLNVEKFRALREALEVEEGFTRENVIKAVNQLAFREAAEIGNMIDDLIKDFLTREGLTFKKVEKPEKMSQKAFDALFGDQGVITRFRDGIIDGDYMVVGASDMVFDKELFENGLVGETDLIAINADGDFNIIDVKALKKGSWDKFDADTQLEEKINALTEEGVSEEDIEKNADVVKLRKDAKFSKKQYFRLQQSIYRNLFYNMTGMMPKRIGLMPLEVEYDTEGNLINAGLASIVPTDDTTIELEYFDVVESVVPLKAQPKKPISETPKDEGLVEEDEDLSPTIANYVGKRVVYGGAIGVLRAEVDGTFSLVNKEGIETIYFEGKPLTKKNLTLNQVGLSPIRKTQRPFETITIDGVKYKVSILGESSAEINGVMYRINWSGTGTEKTIASLTYRANDADIAELELKKESIEEKLEAARIEYDLYLPKNISVDYERRITSINKRLNTEKDNAVKYELIKTRAALEKELQSGKIKQNSKMQQIGLDRLQLEKINAELSSLRETNPKRTMRGGNLNDYIFVINSSPESFKLYKGKNSADQKKDLRTIGGLSVSSAIATKIDLILEENFPEPLNTLIEQGVGSVSATGLDAIFNWANNAIVQLETLNSREAVKGNVTTDIQNQINAIYDLLNDLELIKLTKNGEISKRQPKEVKNIFGESKVPDRASIPKNEGPTSGQAEGVPQPQGGKPTTAQMKSRIAESNITSASLLSSLDTEEGTTTKKGAKFIDAIKKANLDTINEAYINALEELKNNPGTINTTELQDAFEQRMQLLNVDILFDVLEKNDLLLPIYPIFGNTEVSPVTVYKKGPNSIVIQDVNTGATETFTAAQINENFTRMTEEAMAKEDGVQLTPQDVADFQKNTETINETLEDSEALNAAAKAVEEAEKKGTFRDRLKNKNCNI